MEKINIFTDFKIKNIHIKNRIVLPPMVRFSLVKDDGYVTQDLIDWYGMIARSGVGLIIVEASAVEESGKLRENQIGIWNDSFIEGLTKVANEIHKYDVPCMIQIHHAGFKDKIAEVPEEELDRIYTDDSNQDILNRNIVNFQTLINKREYAPTFKEDSTKNIQIFFNNTVNIGFNIKEKIEKLNIKELKVIDLKELYHINFAELVSKIYKKDIQNLDFMNSLTKIYFKFFLKKLLERDTLILKALTM